MSTGLETLGTQAFMGQMPPARDSCDSLPDCMHQTALQNGGHMDVSIFKVKETEDDSQNWIKTKKQLQNKKPNVGIATDAYKRTDLRGISYMQPCEERIYFFYSIFKM